MTTAPAPEATASGFISHEVDLAHQSHSPLVERFRIARADVVIAADETLAASLTAPFAHLRSEAEAAPDLQIRAATMSETLAGELRLDELPEQGRVHATDDSVIHLLPDCAAVLHRSSGTIDAVMRNAGGFESSRRAKPLQMLLSVFFADRGVDLIHGGLVSLDGRGILLAGSGGSGKSTVSLASTLDGFDFLGDDCVGMRESDLGSFEGFSIFGSGCLEPAHAARFSLPAESQQRPTNDKTVIAVGQRFPARAGYSTEIRAVVLPHVTGGSSVTIRPATAAEALLAVAPSSIIKRATPAAAAFARMARMLKRVPAYHLDMGPIAQIAPRLRELLESLD